MAQNASAPGAKSRARAQASAYKSMFSPTDIELTDGTTIEIPPHPNLTMLDDDRQQAYEELLFEVDTEYDRAPDISIPERTLDSGTVIPEATLKGGLLVPYRKDGQLIKPPHSVRIVQIVLGETEYAKLRAGGRSAGDVWRIWNLQGLDIADRELVDPKSDASGGDVVALPRRNR